MIRRILSLSLVLLLPMASAQLWTGSLELTFEGDAGPLAQDETAPVTGTLYRYCDNAASVLDPVTVDLTPDEVDGLETEFASVDLPQYLCATEGPTQSAPVTGELHRTGGTAGAHPVTVTATPQPTDSPLASDQIPVSARFAVTFEDPADEASIDQAEGPTADTPFPTLLVPLALAAAVLARRRS